MRVGGGQGYAEEEEEEEVPAEQRLGPGGQDPVEVFKNLPASLQVGR